MNGVAISAVNLKCGPKGYFLHSGPYAESAALPFLNLLDVLTANNFYFPLSKVEVFVAQRASTYKPV